MAGVHLAKCWPWWRSLRFLLDSSSRRGPALARDAVRLNVAMHACARVTRWEHAVGVLAEFPRRSLRPTVVTYGTVIDALRRGHRWTQVVEIFRVARAEVLHGGHIARNSALAAFESAHIWERAVAFVGELCAENVLVDTTGLNAVIGACARGRHWQRAIGFLDRMGNTGLRPNTQSFNRALDGLVHKNCWVFALQLLTNAQLHRIALNEISYARTVAALRTDKQWRASLFALEVMRREELAPTVETLCSVHATCVSAQQASSEQRVRGLLACAFDAASAAGRPTGAKMHDMSLLHGALDAYAVGSLIRDGTVSAWHTLSPAPGDLLLA